MDDIKNAADNLLLRQKLLKIQIELKAPKSQFNNFGKYNYRSQEDILEAIKPLLEKYNCIVVVDDELVLVGTRYYVKATARIGNSDSLVTDTTISANGWAREEETKKGMDGSQITGTSSSYARKFALGGLFLIDDTRDSDATNKGSKEAPALTDGAKGLIVELSKELQGFVMKSELSNKAASIVIKYKDKGLSEQTIKYWITKRHKELKSTKENKTS